MKKKIGQFLLYFVIFLVLNMSINYLLNQPTKVYETTFDERKIEFIMSNSATGKTIYYQTSILKQYHNQTLVSKDKQWQFYVDSRNSEIYYADGELIKPVEVFEWNGNQAAIYHFDRSKEITILFEPKFYFTEREGEFSKTTISYIEEATLKELVETWKKSEISYSDISAKEFNLILYFAVSPSLFDFETGLFNSGYYQISKVEVEGSNNLLLVNEYSIYSNEYKSYLYELTDIEFEEFLNILR